MRTVVFMGTPDFAVPALLSLIESPDYDVKLVISQPDKPKGRKQEIVFSPVKEIAVKNGIEVYQPENLKSDEAFKKISSYSPDFIVVSAYGKILPQRVLDIPKYGCVNLHGSLLPRYRGAAPIQWSVINGDKKTGVTTMLMNAGLDTGDILLTGETEIFPEETAGELFDRLARLCPELLIKTLNGLYSGTIKPIPQNEEAASYVGMLTKDMALINWADTAEIIHNKVRGMNPWPIAKTKCVGKLLKIYECRVSALHTGGEAGEVFTQNGKIFVSCGENTSVEILELQLEGAKRLSAEVFLRGKSFLPKQKLG